MDCEPRIERVEPVAKSGKARLEREVGAADATVADNCNRNVSVGLVSDREVVEVLDAIQRYLTENARRSLMSSLRIAVAGRSFTLYA
jgi:hypothetical protein